MNSPNHRNPWEDALESALKSLPARRAPATLETRVLAAIAAQQARPWWRKGFAFWPPALRFIFLGLTLAIAAGTAWALLQGTGTAPVATAGEWIGNAFGWWSRARSLTGDLIRLSADSLSSTAQFWILAAISLIALCYATLIGTGAALYRIFMRPE